MLPELFLLCSGMVPRQVIPIKRKQPAPGKLGAPSAVAPEGSVRRNSSTTRVAPQPSTEKIRLGAAGVWALGAGSVFVVQDVAPLCEKRETAPKLSSRTRAHALMLLLAAVQVQRRAALTSLCLRT
jgi:hypothetical protein